jgi:AraC-like DNA-binding protein
MDLPEFYLAFAGSFNRTPVAYIRKRRIEEAQRLLLNPGLTVTKIAYSLGFADGNR